MGVNCFLARGPGPAHTFLFLARNADLGSDTLRIKKKPGFFLLGGGVADPPPKNKKARLFLFVRKKKYAGRAARASQPVPGLVPRPPGQSMAWPSPAQNVGSGQITKNGPNRVQNRRFGLKIGPEACQDRSGAFRTGPATKKK